MSLFKRAASKKASKAEAVNPSIDEDIAAVESQKKSLDIAKMIREELDAENAKAESSAEDVWENPFELHDANISNDEVVDEAPSENDNILPLKTSNRPVERIVPVDTKDDDLSIDDIRKNILRITEDWRLTAAASQELAADDEDPIELASPLSEDEAEPLDLYAADIEIPQDTDLTASSDFDETDANEHEDIVDTHLDIEPIDLELPQIETSFADDTEFPAAEDDTASSAEDFDDSDDIDMNDEADNAPHLTSEGLNLGELRLDIARISSDIDNGEALYRRAQQRVTSLMGFIEKAEVAVSVLNRLQPENRKLISRNRSLETDVEAQKYIIASLESDRTKLRDNLDQANNREETLRGQFTELKSILEERNRENEALLTDADANKLQLERIKTNLEIATRENATLNERMNELSEHIQRLSEEKINTEKTLAAAKADLSDEIDRNNSIEAENSELRISLRTSNRHNSELHNELMEVQDKIVIYKSQHETHLHRRDDRIIVLESRIKELEKVIKHKDEIVQTKTDSVSTLKKAVSRHEIEREKLEKVVEDQNYQLSKAEEELLSSKHDIAELDQQYKDLAKALSKRPATTQVERKRKAKTKPQVTSTSIDDNDDEDPTPLKVSA